jgi:DNA-binding NarL/FixJ family response regulator
MSAAKLLLHIQDDNLRREVTQTLKQPGTPMAFEQHESDWNSLLEHLGKMRPEVLLLDLSAVPGELNIAMRQLRYYSPGTKVIALHSSADPKTILSAMRAGVNEFLHPPLEEVLQTAIERISSASTAEGAPVTR